MLSASSQPSTLQSPSLQIQSGSFEFALFPETGVACTVWEGQIQTDQMHRVIGAVDRASDLDLLPHCFPVHHGDRVLVLEPII